MAEVHHHSPGLTMDYGPATGSESIALTDIHDFEPPCVKNAESDDTTLSSANAVGQNSSGWGKPGESKLTLYHMETQYTNLLAIRQARTTKSWLAQFAAVGNETVGMKFQFSAWIAEIKVTKAEVMNETKIMDEITLQMTGDVTFTSGSPSA